MYWVRLICCFGFMLTVASSSNASESFNEYIADLLLEAEQQGISQKTLSLAKPTITYRATAVKADKNQPEKRITLSDYLATRVPDWKVKQATELHRTHAKLLNDIERQFGVQSRFIVALWGNESNFGRIQGNHPVLSALASLAFEGRRETLFKRQFFAALTILDEGHIALSDFKGSWAGAMGQSQFMPTNFLAYAVDYDGDGKKDIWHSVPDVLASIANFLKQHGWQSHYTWGRQVNAETISDSNLLGLHGEKAKTLLKWQQLGVTKYNGEPLPAVTLDAWLIAPDGLTGRQYLVYDNFQTLMQWNRSSYFGISVSYLSERIKKGLAQ